MAPAADSLDSSTYLQPGKVLAEMLPARLAVLSHLAARPPISTFFHWLKRSKHFYTKRYRYRGLFFLPAILTGQLKLIRLKPLTSLDSVVVWEHQEREPVAIEVPGTVGAVWAPQHGVRILRVNDVVFEMGSNVVLHGGELFQQALPRVATKKPYNEAVSRQSSQVVWNRGTLCALRVSPENQLTFPSGVIVSGAAPDNWYHWMINILPSVMLALDAPGVPESVPLLVPESAKNAPQLEALKMLTGAEREIFFLPLGARVFVDNGYVVEHPVREVVALNGRHELDWRDLGGFNFEVMALFRDSLLGKLEHKSQSVEAIRSGSKIFLARDQSRRPYNQDEVQLFLESRGFKTVVLENLSVADQIRTFNDAKVIVSTTGAQWTGLLFSEAARAIVLTPRFLMGSSLFPRLAFLGGSEIVEVEIYTEDKSWFTHYGTQRPSTVNMDHLARVVDGLS